MAPTDTQRPSTDGRPPSDFDRVSYALHELLDRLVRLENLADVPSADRLLDINEAAEKLHVSVRTVETHVALGDLQVVRIGAGRGVRRFHSSALDAFIRRQTRTL